MKITKPKALKVAAILGVIGIAAFFLTTPVRREIFIAETKLTFSKVKSAEEAKSLSTTGKAFAWILRNGKWALIRAEHHCCSGAGYDAVVIRDSDGKTFVSRKLNICGGTSTISGMDGTPENSDSTTPAEEWKARYPDADWTRY